MLCLLRLGGTPEDAVKWRQDGGMIDEEERGYLKTSLVGGLAAYLFAIQFENVQESGVLFFKICHTELKKMLLHAGMDKKHTRCQHM